jgi:hypothetical protein
MLVMPIVKESTQWTGGLGWVTFDLDFALITALLRLRHP